MKNKIEINNPIFIVLMLLASMFISCDATGDLDPGGTAVQEMAGDWFVELLTDDGSGNLVDMYGIGYYKLSTFNTASDDGTELFLDDHGLWPMKSIANVNLDSKTFSGDGLGNEYDESVTVNIMDGKILTDAATTTGGNKSDSIYFRVIYADDTREFVIKGYKRTGFVEDEH